VSDGVEGRVLEGWLGDIVVMHLKVEVDLEDIRVDSHMGPLMQDIVEVVQEVGVERVDSQAEAIAILRIRESFKLAQEIRVEQVTTEAGGSPVEIPIREAVEAARGVEERHPEATEIPITEVMVGRRSLRSEVDGWNRAIDTRVFSS
jgi:hypothetical protein